MDSRKIDSNIFGDNTQINQNNNFYNAPDGESRQTKIDACRNALFLASPNVDREKLKSTKGERTPGTCEWIRSNETYRSWLNGHSQCLWISGGPGKGKTILSIYLTEELEKYTQEHENTVLLFYFCSPDEKHNSAVAVLRGLAYWLVAKRPYLATHISAEFDSPEKTQETLKSPNALWIVLEKLLGDPGLGVVYCVLDGLDECDDASAGFLVTKFCKYFSKDVKSDGGRLQLAIVSRRIDALDAFPQVRLDPDNDKQVNDDIRSFIASSVQKLERIRGFNTYREKIEAAFLDRAQGTFLWVGLVMEELLKKKTCLEILETLNSIPPGLDTIYDRMLEQIESSRRPVTIEILQWVAVAARPLTFRELKAAVCISSTTEISSEQVIRDYITLCGYILTVHDGKVSLVHQSARDYLMQEQYDNSRKLNKFHIKADQAHARLARICLDCIESSDLRSKSLYVRDASILQKAPLLQYAVLHWPEHARSSFYADKTLNLSRPFFQEKSKLRMHWWETYRAADIFRFGDYNPSLLHMASSLGIDSLVRKLLPTNAWYIYSMFRNPVNQKDIFGFTALSRAVRGGYTSTVQLLITNGADINAKDGSGKAPLIIATIQEDEAIVQLLLKNGAGVNIKDEDGNTALNIAAREGLEAIIQILLINGADVNAKTDYGETALNIAASERRKTIVQLLLTNGADVNATDWNGWTALHKAAREGHEAFVQLLLENGATINAKDEYGRTALSIATEEEHEAVMQLLLTNDADVNTTDWNGRTALHKAAQEGHEEFVQLLLENGAAINLKDKSGRTALSIATEEQHEALMQLLLINGADVNSTDSNGRTALCIATEKGHETTMRVLLKNGAAINLKNESGMTALVVASNEGHEAGVQLLLKNNAHTYIDIQDKYGRTALSIAVEKGYKAIAQLLLTNRAKVNTKDKNGQTALLKAVYYGHNSIVQLLLAHHANTNIKDIYGQTALMKATYNGHITIMQLLIANHANINMKDIYGQTALTLAVLNGRNAIIKLLLANGADDKGGKARQAVIESANKTSK